MMSVNSNSSKVKKLEKKLQMFVLKVVENIGPLEVHQIMMSQALLNLNKLEKDYFVLSNMFLKRTKWNLGLIGGRPNQRGFNSSSLLKSLM